jgi:hypothetical protein
VKLKATDRRYEAFSEDAKELLLRAGFSSDDDVPKITGYAFLEACNQLATIHFPDDKEVGGTGPRGLLWNMYRAMQGATSRIK